MKNSTLLVLFDAENLAIQKVFRIVESIVIKEFSEKIWNNAKLVTSYKEKTEYHSNKGYNNLIQTYYVGQGKDKADKKLIDVAKENIYLDIVIVSSDKELISSIQEVAKGSVLVCNARRIYSYVVDEINEGKILEKDLEEKKKHYFSEYNKTKKALKDINAHMIKKRKVLKMIQKDNPYVVDMKEYNFNPFQNTILEGFNNNIKPHYVKTHPKLREISLEIIEHFLLLPKIKERLETSGPDVSVIKMAIEYTVIDFQKDYFGFTKFINFIRFFVKGSQLKLVFKEPSQYKVILKAHSLEGFINVEMFEDDEIVETVESISDLYLEKKAPTSLNLEFLENLKKNFESKK